MRRRIILTYLFLAVFNIAAWGVALVVFYRLPAALGLCLVAYGFGLRHAVDADHIAAIDNVTRKLMQQRQQPVAVGLFFSLGHSTVVILMTILVAVAAGYMEKHFPVLRKFGPVVGTSISALFLLIIAAINFTVFLGLYQTYRRVQQGETYQEETLDEFLGNGGLVTRLVRPLFRLVSQSWHMYPVGFLFGLGFDTSSEVALLGIAATQAAQHVPLWSILIFPILFTAGMALVDTSDGVIMLGAYGWAFIQPGRKLVYNLTITLVSFAVAFLIGGLEALGLLADKFDLHTGFWAVVKYLNEQSGSLGYCVIAVLLFSWLVAVVIHKRAKPAAVEVLAVTSFGGEQAMNHENLARPSLTQRT
jgi:high-affinity nickel-transport protein